MQPEGESMGIGAPASVADRAAALAGFTIFAGMEPDSLRALAADMRPRRWAAGRMIFARGDPGDHMLAVTSGRIRLSLSTAQGREMVLDTMGPGEILGEMALLDGAPRSADATAMEETACLLLPRARFEAEARRRPDIGLALARHLSARLRRTNFQMESIALYDLRARLVRFLLLALREAPGDGARRRLRPGLSQSDIAAILGASRPKVSAAFQSLFATGAVRREGDGYLCDIAALEELLEEDGPA
jgi:CRP/FNR family transcriptional regulator, cyclic AMP receptor protein